MGTFGHKSLGDAELCMPYSARLVSFAERPVLSFVDGSSSFAQVFNPSYVVPSNGTAGRAGLLARTQNCSALPAARAWAATARARTRRC